MPTEFTVFAKNRALRFVTVASYLTIALLSSVPGELRPHVPGVSDKVEHLMAFLALGALTMLTAPRHVSSRLLVVGLVTYAAVLELSQIVIPGRVASLADLAASSSGVVLGITLGGLIRPSLAATRSALSTGLTCHAVGGAERQVPSDPPTDMPERIKRDSR